MFRRLAAGVQGSAEPFFVALRFRAWPGHGILLLQGLQGLATRRPAALSIGQRRDPLRATPSRVPREEEEGSGRRREEGRRRREDGVRRREGGGRTHYL